MIRHVLDHIKQDGRIGTLSLLILVQIGCVLFFIIDVIADLLADDGGALDHVHTAVEAIAAAALAAGVVILGRELRKLLADVESMQRGIRMARGDMAALLESQFATWGLTPSERDVAMLLLKGLDNAAIADLRGTAPGTVRAQCSRIYSKAGVEGRADLFSFFVEELMTDL